LGGESGLLVGLAPKPGELGAEFPEVFNLFSAQSLRVVAQTQELARPLTPAEIKRMQEEPVSRDTFRRENMAQKTRWHSYREATTTKCGFFASWNSRGCRMLRISIL
jgi:hypothetical protein